MEKIEHFTARLIQALDEHIPQGQRGTFMVTLSTIMEGIEDRQGHPDRIKVFNAVHKQLSMEAKQAS